MTKRITFSAILMALTIICLCGATALSTGRLAALALASLFVAVCVRQYGVRTAFVLYVGAALLALLLVPKRMYALLYVLFVGYYPILKLFIEQLHKLWAEWLIKIVYFNVMMAVLYLVFRLFFMSFAGAVYLASLSQLRYAALAILGLEAAFVIYDVAMSYMLSYYEQLLRRIHHA